MTTSIFLQLARFFHLIGLTLAVGILLASFVAGRQGWALLAQDKASGLAAFRSMATLQVVGAIGLMLLLLSGAAMLALLEWTLLSLLWFQLKLLAVGLLFLNGFSMGRKQTLNLQALIAEEKKGHGQMPDFTRLKRNLQIFQLTQLSLFMLIILLSVFRFS